MTIDVGLAQGSGSEIWKSTLELVKSLSDVITSSLPNFWKIAKDYMEGKFKKVRLVDLGAFVPTERPLARWPAIPTQPEPMPDYGPESGPTIHRLAVRILYTL